MSVQITRWRLESLVKDYNEQFGANLRLGYDDEAEMYSIYDPDSPEQEVTGYEETIEQMLLDWLRM